MIKPWMAVSLGLLAVAGCQKQEPDATSPEAATTQPAVAGTEASPPATGPAIVPAATPAEPSPVVLSSQPGPQGTTWNLTKVATVGEIMTVQFDVKPAPGRTVFVTGLPIDDAAVIDDATSQRYGVLKDDAGRPQASPLQSEGKTLRLSSSRKDVPVVVWLKFPALPAGSETLSITIPEVGAFDGIRVTR